MRPPNRNNELESFKTTIDLREVIASRGYVLDPRRSSRSYTVLRNPAGDKLIVTRKPNGHWVYANAHDARDRGTVIDFLSLRERVSLGEVRKLLRPWLGSERPVIAALKPLPPLSPLRRDVAGVASAWERAEPIGGRHDYLQRDRFLPAAVLADPVFAGVIRADGRRNALFAHFDADGLCGFEIKNRGFTGFSPGGSKTLFTSAPSSVDNELVVCESAIDLLSYAALFGTAGRRFVSVAGQLSPVQLSLILAEAKALPTGGRVVLAFDNDDGGRGLARQIAPQLRDIGAEVALHLPDGEGDDWNDVLRRRSHDAAPALSPP